MGARGAAAGWDVSGGSDAVWTGAVGTTATACAGAVDCRDDDEDAVFVANGFENGLSANRTVSELHAEAAPPIRTTRAKRDTAPKPRSPTHTLMLAPPTRDTDVGD
jgi:hypothetical protein